MACPVNKMTEKHHMTSNRNIFLFNVEFEEVIDTIITQVNIINCRKIFVNESQVLQFIISTSFCEFGVKYTILCT